MIKLLVDILMLKNIIVFTIFLTTFNLLSANEDFIAYLRSESSSSGNIADAVEQITGSRAWLNPDIKVFLKKNCWTCRNSLDET